MNHVRNFQKEYDCQPLLLSSITPRDGDVLVGRDGRVPCAPSVTSKPMAVAKTKKRSCSSEIRRCAKCSGWAIAERYKRAGIRFVDIFYCQYCNARFRQDSRGFQGFYAGNLLSLMSPPLLACITTNKIPPTIQAYIVVAFLLSCIPILRNLLQYIKMPVIQKGKTRFASRDISGRGHFSQTLRGNNMTAGLIYGIVTGAVLYVGLSGVAATVLLLL